MDNDQILTKMNIFNNENTFMFHQPIWEYDMNAASLSLADRFKLLPPETIQRLKLLPKEKRVIQTGLIRKDNKEFSVTVDQKLRDVRKEFIEENHIGLNDILSLHSDAIIFTSRKRIKSTIDGITFKQSSHASGYIRYNSIEIFYDDGAVTYKGGNKELLKYHTMGISKYLAKIFEYVENYNPDVLTYMSKFQSNYLRDQFPEFVYSPFGMPGKFKLSNLDFFAFIAKVILKETSRWDF